MDNRLSSHVNQTWGAKLSFRLLLGSALIPLIYVCVVGPYDERRGGYGNERHDDNRDNHGERHRDPAQR